MGDFYESDAWLSFGCGHPGGEDATRALLSHVKPGGRILDLCCGAGTSTALAAGIGFDAAGVDRPGALRHAVAAHPELRFMEWQGGALPFSDGEFDAVLCECSFSLLDAPAETAQELCRILRADGKLLISDLYDRTEPPALHGFELAEWTDKTEELKTFAAQWIWETGEKLPCEYAKGSGYYAAVYVLAGSGR